MLALLIVAPVSAHLRASSTCTPRRTSEGGFPALEASDQVSSGLKVSGSLVIAGGSLAKNSSVFQRFLELAGGEQDAKIVYFPTNGGGRYETPAQQQSNLDSFLDTSCWQDLTNPVVLMHTYDPARADEDDFIMPLEDATGVYFAGGLPHRAYDSYFGTATQAALERVLARGGVVGGSSAGALMQSNIMLRGDRSNDNSIMLGDAQEGFGFGGMVNIAVDVHYLARNRASDIVEVIAERPELLGFSIDENTALVMIGNEVEVVGAGWVGVYDSTLWQNVSYCANFNLYSPRVARPLIPSQGTVFMMGADIAGRQDKYNVKTREVARSKVAETMGDDWSTEA